MTLKYLLFVVWAIFGISAFSAGEEREEKPLPLVKVLPLDEQEALFVKAYEAVGPDKIHPTETPIPGLRPMIEMHYSFTHGLVKDSPKHLRLLKSFWQKTSDILDTGPLTIGRMKDIALQLAFLLTDVKLLNNPSFKDTLEKSRSFSAFQDLYDTEKWKDISFYDETAQFYKESFCLEDSSLACEAILCCQKGSFPFNLFVKNYLSHPFVLHLSSLGLIEGEGPHGGIVSNPASFFLHDLMHSNAFIEKYGISLTRWAGYGEKVRSILKKVYDSSLDSRINIYAIFLILHEDATSFSAPHSGLDLSEKDFFLALREDRIKRKGMDVFFFPSIFSLFGEEKDFFARINNFEQKTNETYRLNFLVRKNRDDLKMIADFSIDVSFNKTGKDFYTMLDNPSQISWTEDEEINPQTQEFILQEIHKWIRFNKKTSRHYWCSLDEVYKTLLRDYEYGIKYVYGKDIIPADASFVSRAKIIGEKLEELWENFYHNNKDLFSTDPL